MTEVSLLLLLYLMTFFLFLLEPAHGLYFWFILLLMGFNYNRFMVNKCIWGQSWDDNHVTVSSPDITLYLLHMFARKCQIKVAHTRKFSACTPAVFCLCRPVLWLCYLCLSSGSFFIWLVHLFISATICLSCFLVTEKVSIAFTFSYWLILFLDLVNFQSLQEHQPHTYSKDVELTIWLT